MCMRATEEGCVLAEQQTALKKEVAALDVRMTKLEGAFSTMRTETQEGFKQGAVAMREINTSVSNLAHDFGDRMNNLDKRIIVEKEKWGETLRKILTWGAKALILGALVAMGVNIVNSVIKSFFSGG